MEKTILEEFLSGKIHFPLVHIPIRPHLHVSSNNDLLGYLGMSLLLDLGWSGESFSKDGN